MKIYELLTIFKPNLDAEEIDKAFKKVSDVVEGFDGKVESVDKIGRKKLAYDIEKFRDGFFVCANVSIPADKVAEFKRQLRLNDNILRTMFMEVSKNAELSK
jgi:small subunit ribosomal protein S6